MNKRLNPNSILRRIADEEKRASRGSLKIFLGYAPNVGKTYRLVEELSRRKLRGEDVVVGWAGRCLSAHVRELLSQLEQIAPLDTQELDLQAILARRPRVCAIDELAHDNTPGSRNAYRWQDVVQLLEAGINVVTAVNVQFLEGLQAKVLALTGKVPQELVPDAVLLMADEVTLVDVTPQEVDRRSCQSGRPLTLNKQQLRELREMALLYTAETIEGQLHDFRESQGIDAIWATQERLLVCVTAHERGPSLVTRGAAAAQRLHGELRVLYISPDAEWSNLDAQQREQVQTTLALAASLRAKTDVVVDSQPAECIVTYAREHGITQIFIGHSVGRLLPAFFTSLHRSVVGVLIREASGSDVHVIPDGPGRNLAAQLPVPAQGLNCNSLPARTARGKLKIYLGYAPGVGKTFEMLRQAQVSLEEGCDVVVGYYEDLGRAATNAQLGRLPIVPRRHVHYRDHDFQEMDLPAILARRPAICLVDELPHTNPPGQEHEKRWQDVEELLDAGIDVQTTLNIQHLESYNDQFYTIAHVRVRETVPDWMITGADEVVMIDLATQALLNRLRRGVIYPLERANAALANFFRPETLSALRELALRHTVEASESRPATLDEAPDDSREAVLVCLTERASGGFLLRRAKQLADRLHARCYAVHVSSTQQQALPVAVQAHFRLAANLHVQTELLVSRQVGPAVLEFARTHGVTQMYLGRSLGGGVRPYLALGLIEQLIKTAPNLQFHIVADR